MAPLLHLPIITGARLVGVVVLAFVATSCTVNSTSTASVAAPTPPAVQGSPAPSSPQPATTQTPSTAIATPTPEGSIQDVAAATVKIIAEGAFVPPFELMESNVAGIGSGFIIDSSGTVVTNNHVVTGATDIQVFLDGRDAPTNAILLGVSECNDLAVLQLDGEGYPSLEFRNSEGVTPGLPVFAAGYPLNFDTDFQAVDYTLTAGIVSTTQASGETSWASIDSVLEHDARIRGGNSGGPLVDEQGRVVGINYAGESINDLNEAIAAAQALPVIEALRNGDVESLGINGQATVTEQVSGVWVAAVADQTPAALAGLVPGDLILTMNGQPLAVDGTMATYCEIVRSSGDDPIDIEVLRLGTDELLEGQINGEPLLQTFSLTNELENEMVEASNNAGFAYTDYVLITDVSANVQVEVPVQWNDRDGSANPDFGESLFASPDLDAFRESWTVPGIIIERSTGFTAADQDDVLDLWDLPCETRSGRENFATNDGDFTGRWEVFSQCGGTDGGAVTIAVSPVGGNSLIRVFVQLATDADIAATQRAIATFNASP